LVVECQGVVGSIRGSMKPLHSSCSPRLEVVQGELSDSIFAADFGALIEGRAPEVYSKPEVFFSNTLPTPSLCKVAHEVFANLTAGSAGKVCSLSTGFGGGKTHALMTLWHLATAPGHPAAAHFLNGAVVKKDTICVAFDLGKSGVPQFKKYDDGTSVESFHAALFYEIAERALGAGAGAKIVAELGATAAVGGSPSSAQLKSLFDKIGNRPLVILIDETVIYLAKLVANQDMHFLGTLNMLLSECGNRPNTSIVITDPAQTSAYEDTTAKLRQALSDILARNVTAFDPLKDQSAQMIVKRLFSNVDRAAALEAAEEYQAFYRRLNTEAPEVEVQPYLSEEGKQTLIRCYPFHPELIKLVEGKLSIMPNFHKSRGVLRLFSRIVRNAWRPEVRLGLINVGDVDWADDGIKQDLLNRLQRENFAAAITADICGQVTSHATQDDEAQPNLDSIHRRIAGALLMASLDVGKPGSGMTRSEAGLAVLRPSDAPKSAAEAFGRLETTCWHLYGDGTRLYFKYEPNVIRQIHERAASVSQDDVDSRIKSDLAVFYTGSVFKAHKWPDGPSGVPDNGNGIKLALVETPEIALATLKSRDDAGNARVVRNQIVGVAAEPDMLLAARKSVRFMLAAEMLNRELQHGSEGYRQLEKILPERRKLALLDSYRAFNQVFLIRAGHVTRMAMEEEFLIKSDQPLQQPQGQQNLHKYLIKKQLMFGPGQTLAPTMLSEMLRGVPTVPGDSEVASAKSVHELFLRSSQLVLIQDDAFTRDTLIRASKEGVVVVTKPNGDSYFKGQVYSGALGRSRRVSIGDLEVLEISEDTLVSLADTSRAKEWTLTTGEKDLPPPPPPPSMGNGEMSVNDFERFIKAVGEGRVIKNVRLECAQPEQLLKINEVGVALFASDGRVDLSIRGSVKNAPSEMISLSVQGLKVSHSFAPITKSAELLRTLDSPSSTLTIAFHPPIGHKLTVEQAEAFRKKTPPGVKISASFGAKP
jgi:Protein of unknown function (DUF499)